uniref:Uncharacterized protein n=1 Tax=Romanomermis culicivorax TaxID=13658 RepID=A0A915L6Q4_ROMCU
MGMIRLVKASEVNLPTVADSWDLINDNRLQLVILENESAIGRISPTVTNSLSPICKILLIVRGME